MTTAAAATECMRTAWRSKRRPSQAASPRLGGRWPIGRTHCLFATRWRQSWPRAWGFVRVRLLGLPSRAGRCMTCRWPLQRSRAQGAQPHLLQPARLEAGAGCSGVEPTRANSMHALRHYGASVLQTPGSAFVRLPAGNLGRADPVHAEGLHALDAQQRGPGTPCDRHALGPRADSVRSEGIANSYQMSK